MSLVARMGGGGGTLPRAFSIPCGRHRPASGIWLFGPGGPHNLSPIVIPFPSRLIAVSLATRTAGTWDAEIYRNLDVRNGGAPLVASALAVVPVSGTDAESATMSVDLAATDELGVYVRGSMVDRPQVILYLVRRS